MSYSIRRPPSRGINPHHLSMITALSAAILATTACGPNGEPPAQEASAAETPDTGAGPAADTGARPAAATGRAGDASTDPDSLPTVPMRLGDRVPGSHLLLDAWHGDTRGRVIELYVQGERDGAGRMMWDDGHHWLLVVRDGEKMARLVDAFVPNGTVRFWVVTGARPEPTVVTQIDSGTAGVETAEWVWDADRESWISPSSVRVVGNLVHRTAASALR